MLADAVTAALDALVAEAGGPAWDPQGFARLRGHVAGRLAAKTSEVIAAAVRVLDARREVERAPRGGRRPGVRGGAAWTSAASSPGSCRPASSPAPGAARLPDVERYLQGAARRLERLPDAAAVDRDRMRAIHELEDAYRRAAGVAHRAPTRCARCRGCSRSCASASSPRVSAPAGPVSAKRIRRALEAAA